jgi:alanine racemase
MQIIDELEPTRRGPYGGAVGYLDFAGNMDTCIALRTIVWKNGVFDVQAGAGVVADSVPESEYEETMNKAKAMLKAVEIAAIRNGWVLTVSSLAAVDDVARIALACERQAAIQVMVDTGMTRCGVGADDLPELLRRIESRPSLRLSALGTHFANAERPDDQLNAEQLERFRRATDDLAAAMPGRFLRHAANTAALFFAPASHLDMVRPGIGLYGIDPTGRPSQDRPLRPVMKWTAPLVSVRRVPKGTGVGYGQTWTAPRETRIGLVPVGYADGYPRRFEGQAVVLIGGRTAPVVGRISMDMITINLSDIAAQVGDEVTLLDSDPLSPVSAYQLSKWAQTIPYEILCRIGPRMPRVALDADVPAQRLPAASV